MNKEKYQVGLIGALAEIADAHLDAIDFNPLFSLKGVCDLDHQQLANKFSKEKALLLTTDYHTLLANEEINTIVICSPNHLHAPMAIEALKANKNVLCEKPMTISIAQCEEVLKASKKSEGTFVISYHFEFPPEVAFLKKELKRFGPIKRFLFESSEHLFPGKDWIFVPKSGGVWLDWAPNAISVLRRILSQNNCLNDFKIVDARLGSSLGLDIETDVYVKLLLDQIEGELKIDWEADPEVFKAQTTFWNTNNDEIKLDHASSHLFLNGEVIWQGIDSRYREVYADFAKRLEAKSSNIESGFFEHRLMEEVFQF